MSSNFSWSVDAQVRKKSMAHGRKKVTSKNIHCSRAGIADKIRPGMMCDY